MTHTTYTHYIGTTFKDMKLKPSILDEFKDIYGITGAVQTIKNYCSEVSSRSVIV